MLHWHLHGSYVGRLQQAIGHFRQDLGQKRKLPHGDSLEISKDLNSRFVSPK